MGVQKSLMKIVLLGLYSLAAAQINTFSPQSQNDIFYSITVLRSTASSSSGAILFQIRAPTTYQWVALGQGTQMAGAGIFVLYSASSQNVTISPRSGAGHVQPEYNSQTQLSLLEGNRGSSLDSDSIDADIGFHDDFGGTSVELANAVSTSTNPFLNHDPASPSIQPSNILTAHGLIMGIAFVVLFPSSGLLTALPVPGIIVKAHAPLQIFTPLMVFAGMGLGIKLGVDNDMLTDVHPILGFIVIGFLVLFQPALGLLQHMHFRRTGRKDVFAYVHRWLGRVVLVVAIVTGGLGFRLADIDTPYTPSSAVIAYSIIAGIMGLLYITVQVFRSVKERERGKGDLQERKRTTTSPEIEMSHYNALIRTHHITSRKKVSALKRAADAHNCFALLRSGGCPGIMYVEATEKDDVEGWVNTVKNLRYKDFQLVSRPAAAVVEGQQVEQEGGKKDELGRGLEEVESVKEFGSLMEQRGIWGWWRKAMGYAS
ncbi:hypothetical protein BJX99DRAFT_251479 [Aspergillus californicus]